MIAPILTSLKRVLAIRSADLRAALQPNLPFPTASAGYVAEDTDFGFGFQTAADGLKPLSVGQAIACHQYRESYEPPAQHVAEIVRNARQFHARWGRWAMVEWLAYFKPLGRMRWLEDMFDFACQPTAGEMVPRALSRQDRSESKMMLEYKQDMA